MSTVLACADLSGSLELNLFSFLESFAVLHHSVPLSWGVGGASCRVGFGRLRLTGVPSVLMCVRVCTYVYITEVLCRMSFGSSGLVTRLFCNALPLALVLPVSRAINNQQLWAVLAWMSTESLSSR